MDKNVNEKLLAEQIYWVNNILKNYWISLQKDSTDTSCAGQDKILSHPFYFGLTDEYIYQTDDRKRLMIVGQEAMGYGMICDGTAKYDFVNSCASKKCEENTNECGNSQEWAKAYLIKQLYDINIKLPDCYKKEIESNNSPFWKFFGALKDKFVLCWNNLDKVYFANTGELTCEAEKELSKRYAKEGEKEEKSLLQREIELAEPDMVLFVTGPDYGVSMSVALGVNEFNDKPKTDKKVRDITDIINLTSKTTGKIIPAFWTFHPNYLSHTKALTEVVNEIIKKIY